GRHLGGWLPAEQLLHVQRLAGLWPAALLARFSSNEIDGFPCREHGEQSPEVIAVLELRELAAFRPAAEAAEGPQRAVLLVGQAARCGAQLLTGQRHQLVRIPLPEFLRGLVVAAS